jgi:hypothetical protein
MHPSQTRAARQHRRILSRAVNTDACTGSDCLDRVLQLRPPFAWHKPEGLRGVT